jgi:hypothetical protein
VRRTRLYIVIGFAVFVFLGISLLLARALSATGAERDLVLQLARAEARGDADGVLARTPQCAADAACAASTRAFLPRLKRPGDVQILRYDVSIQLPMTRQIGTGRVAWRAGTSLPVVQCVRVQRDGPLTGAGVVLLAVSAPIGGEASCP